MNWFMWFCRICAILLGVAIVVILGGGLCLAIYTDPIGAAIAMSVVVFIICGVLGLAFWTLPVSKKEKP